MCGSKNQQNKDNHYKAAVERCILIYLRSREEFATAKKLTDSIGISYQAILDKPNCYAGSINKADIVNMLHTLEQKGLVKFSGGRQWTLTENGKKVADDKIESQKPIVTRFPKLLHRRLTKKGFASISLEDMREIATEENLANIRKYALGVKTKGDEVVVYMGNDWIMKTPQRDFYPSGDGTVPNFNDVEIVDCGNTLRLGEYECRVWK